VCGQSRLHGEGLPKSTRIGGNGLEVLFEEDFTERENEQLPDGWDEILRTDFGVEQKITEQESVYHGAWFVSNTNKAGGIASPELNFDPSEVLTEVNANQENLWISAVRTPVIDASNASEIELEFQTRLVGDDLVDMYVLPIPTFEGELDIKNTTTDELENNQENIIKPNGPKTVKVDLSDFDVDGKKFHVVWIILGIGDDINWYIDDIIVTGMLQNSSY